jgi:hypothetical protein
MRKTAISMGTPTDAMVETVARPASLGMYDFPWLRRANDTFWAAVARELRSRGVQAVPQHLDRARPLDQYGATRTCCSLRPVVAR